MCSAFIKGRGALNNREGRFEPTHTESVDDGWGSQLDDGPRPRTEFFTEKSKSAISTNKSPDLSFDQSINPYRGCEHGCVYCFARPTHAYLGYSAGLDFETRITVKPDVPDRLRAALASPRYRCRSIALGTNTDCYQPGERRFEITREILSILQEHRHPVGVVTKSALVLRDVDILAEMAARNLATVRVSITTLRADLARTLEPRAAAPHRRLEVVRELAAAGVSVGVMVAPVIPGLTDEELERIVDASVEAGATRIDALLLRLPGEVDEIFREWLEQHEPGRAKKVLSLLDSVHGVAEGGNRGGNGFGVRHRGQGRFADLFAWRLNAARKRAKLSDKPTSLDCTQFRVPKSDESQLTLFEEGSS